jgi:hypothetical protein
VRRYRDFFITSLQLRAKIVPRRFVHCALCRTYLPSTPQLQWPVVVAAPPAPDTRPFPPRQVHEGSSCSPPLHHNLAAQCGAESSRQEARRKKQRGTLAFRYRRGQAMEAEQVAELLALLSNISMSDLFWRISRCHVAFQQDAPPSAGPALSRS